MTDFTPIEEALRQLHGGVRALMLIGVGTEDIDPDGGAAINFVADKMLIDVKAAQEWFDAAHTDATSPGPVAVS